MLSAGAVNHGRISPALIRTNVVFFQFVSNTRKDRSEGGDRDKIQDFDETMSIKNRIMTV